MPITAIALFGTEGNQISNLIISNLIRRIKRGGRVEISRNLKIGHRGKIYYRDYVGGLAEKRSLGIRLLRIFRCLDNERNCFYVRIYCRK